MDFMTAVDFLASRSIRVEMDRSVGRVVYADSREILSEWRFRNDGAGLDLFEQEVIFIAEYQFRMAAADAADDAKFASESRGLADLIAQRGPVVLTLA